MRPPRPIEPAMPRRRPRPRRASFSATRWPVTPGFTASSWASGPRHGPRCGRTAKGPIAPPNRRITRHTWPLAAGPSRGWWISTALPCCGPRRPSTVPTRVSRPGTRSAAAAPKEARAVSCPPSAICGRLLRRSSGTAWSTRVSGNTASRSSLAGRNLKFSAVDPGEHEVDRANESDHDLVVVDRIRAWRRGGALIAGNAVLRASGSSPEHRFATEWSNRRASASPRCAGPPRRHRNLVHSAPRRRRRYEKGQAVRVAPVLSNIFLRVLRENNLYLFL